MMILERKKNGQGKAVKTKIGTHFILLQFSNLLRDYERQRLLNARNKLKHQVKNLQDPNQESWLNDQYFFSQKKEEDEPRKNQDSEEDSDIEDRRQNREGSEVGSDREIGPPNIMRKDVAEETTEKREKKEKKEKKDKKDKKEKKKKDKKKKKKKDKKSRKKEKDEVRERSKEADSDEEKRERSRSLD